MIAAVDMANELLIQKLALEVRNFQDAKQFVAAKLAFKAMSEAVASRSLDQVERMDREKGLK